MLSFIVYCYRFKKAWHCDLADTRRLDAAAAADDDDDDAMLWWLCIKVVINKRPMKLLEEALTGVNVRNCDHPCAGQPCLHGGRCHADKDLYRCSCPLGFVNTNCEDRTPTIRSLSLRTRPKMERYVFVLISFSKSDETTRWPVKLCRYYFHDDWHLWLYGSL